MDSQKILLVNTPFYRLMGSHYNGLNLGIGYIAAVLRQHGHEAVIYNADYLSSDDYLNQRGIFEGFNSYKEILHNVHHPIWNEVVNNILDFGPDFLGFSLYTANIKAARIIAKKVKEADKNIKIVVGGDHPTINPLETIAYGEFDYLIFGEGEFALLDIVNGRKKNLIPGLCYKENGQIVKNPERPFIQNLDELPFPEREAFLNPAEKIDVGQVITGRGCPNACSFCVSPKKWSRITRLRSPENVIAELRYLKEKFNPKLIYFVDDTFTLHKKRVKKLLNLMIEENLNFEWKCDTRADCIDDEIASLMKKAGCIRAKIGVESGSERILRKIKKRETKEQIRRGINLLKKYDVPITVYLMAGIPDETDEDLRQTIDFAKELRVDYYSLSILAPYFGTEIYYELKENGYKFDKENWEYFYHQSGEMIVNNNIAPSLLEEFLALNEFGKGGRV